MSVARGEDPWLLPGTEWPLLFSYRMVTGYQGTPIKIGCRSQIDQSGGAAVRRLDTVIGN